MSWQSLPAALMAAVVLYLGAYHLFIYVRRPQERRELSFALLCFAFGAFDIFAAALYSSTTVTEGAVWQKWQSVSLGASGAALLWFIAEYMRLTPRKLIVTGAGLYLVLGFIAVLWAVPNLLSEFSFYNRFLNKKKKKK